MANKLDERAIIERARKMYPWFPPGEIVDHEAPDVVLVDGPDRIGIEVTRLFQPPKPGQKFTPHQANMFYRRVIKRAEEIADKTLPPLDVAVYFDTHDHLTNERQLAQSLVDFVKAHPVERCQTFDKLDELPKGYSVVRVAQPWANQRPGWHCWDSGETLLVTYDQLASIIADKNTLVPAYRRTLDRCWLIIAATMWPFASSFAVPRDVDQWQFDFEFDKVLLSSDESGVFNLQRVERAA